MAPTVRLCNRPPSSVVRGQVRSGQTGSRSKLGREYHIRRRYNQARSDLEHTHLPPVSIPSFARSAYRLGSRCRCPLRLHCQPVHPVSPPLETHNAAAGAHTLFQTSAGDPAPRVPIRRRQPGAAAGSRPDMRPSIPSLIREDYCFLALQLISLLSMPPRRDMREAGTPYPGGWGISLSRRDALPTSTHVIMMLRRSREGRLFRRHDDAMDGWGYPKADALTAAGYVRGGGGAAGAAETWTRGSGGAGAPHSSLSPVPVPVCPCPWLAP